LTTFGLFLVFYLSQHAQRNMLPANYRFDSYLAHKELRQHLSSIMTLSPDSLSSIESLPDDEVQPAPWKPVLHINDWNAREPIAWWGWKRGTFHVSHNLCRWENEFPTPGKIVMRKGEKVYLYPVHHHSMPQFCFETRINELSLNELNLLQPAEDRVCPCVNACAIGPLEELMKPW
jgi:hypothetical protein